MITLPSPGGPRTELLSLAKIFWANSKSQEVSAMKFSSSEDEDKSITGDFLEGPPFSNTGERGQREKISDGDSDDDGDLDGVGGGVLASLGEGPPSAEAEHEHLVPLLSPIAGELRTIEENPKRRKEEEEESKMAPSMERERYL
jgi:hypothetical protein